MNTATNVKRKKSSPNKTSKKPRSQQNLGRNIRNNFLLLEKDYDEYHAFCSVYITDFNVSHGGILDVKNM